MISCQRFASLAPLATNRRWDVTVAEPVVRHDPPPKLLPAPRSRSRETSGAIDLSSCTFILFEILQRTEISRFRLRIHRNLTIPATNVLEPWSVEQTRLAPNPDNMRPGGPSSRRAVVSIRLLFQDSRNISSEKKVFAQCYCSDKKSKRKCFLWNF